MTRQPEPVRLAYEPPPPPAGRPPVWVIAVAASYVLLILGLIVLPLLARLNSSDEFWWFITITVTGLVASWISLLWVPIRVARRLPVTRRSLLVPILGSGFLAGVLIFGLSLAVAEWMTGVPDAAAGWTVLALGVCGWVAWGIVFWLASAGGGGSRGVESHAARLARTLLAGSALELLVAVPAHVVVRRRTECCAGVGTAVGICCGIAVALVSLGPGVFLLYRRRCRQITRPGSR
jgi:hypothetical protein